MEKLKYYIVKIRNLEIYRTTWHIIKAISVEEALRIREQHGISYPRNATNLEIISCEELNMKLKINKDLIERRKQGFGGSIWYVENGILKTEL